MRKNKTLRSWRKALLASVSVLALCFQTASILQAASYSTTIRDKAINIADEITVMCPEQVRTAVLNRTWCAHRGYSALLPENSAPAFILAGILGAYAIEGDVQMSSDGKLYMSHSAYVDAAETKLFKSLSSKEINKQRLAKGVNRNLFSNLGYCMFEDYMNICAEYGCVPIIDLKTGPENGKNQYTPSERRIIADKILTFINSKYYGPDPIVASSSPEMIHAFRKVDETCSVRVAAMSYDRRPEKWREYGDLAKNGKNSVWRWMTGNDPVVDKHFYNYNPIIGEIDPKKIS